MSRGDLGLCGTLLSPGSRLCLKWDTYQITVNIGLLRKIITLSAYIVNLNSLLI